MSKRGKFLIYSQDVDYDDYPIGGWKPLGYFNGTLAEAQQLTLGLKYDGEVGRRRTIYQYVQIFPLDKELYGLAER